jgi:ribonuclease HI
MLDWLARVREADMDISLMVIYQMWLARNDARDSGLIENPESIALRAIKLMEEWHGLNDTKPTKVQAPKERWIPPAEGWVKVNSDGAMAKSVLNAGGGVVIRDHDGRFLAGSSHFFPSLSDPEEAELRACEQGLMLVKQLNIPKVVLEMDSSVLVTKLCSDQRDRSRHGPRIEKLKRAAGEIEDCVIKWARRSANGVAHKLAKEGCGLGSNRIWFNLFPACIEGELARDLVVV